MTPLRPNTDFDQYLPVVRDPGPPPVYRPEPLPGVQQAPQPTVVHYHEAPAPDRTVQRLALGAGVGGGAVVAGVYFGPLLVGALTAIAADLAVLALLVAVSAWGIVSVVRSVGGKEGQAAAKTVSRRGRGRRP